MILVKFMVVFNIFTRTSHRFAQVSSSCTLHRNQARGTLYFHKYIYMYSYHFMTQFIYSTKLRLDTHHHIFGSLPFTWKQVVRYIDPFLPFFPRLQLGNWISSYHILFESFFSVFINYFVIMPHVHEDENAHNVQNFAANFFLHTAAA
jgi:hypothetical protein